MLYKSLTLILIILVSVNLANSIPQIFSDSINTGYFKASSTLTYDRPFDVRKSLFEFIIILDDVSQELELPIRVYNIKILYIRDSAKVEQLIAEENLFAEIKTVGKQTIINPLPSTYKPWSSVEESGTIKYVIEYSYVKKQNNEIVQSTFTSPSKPIVFTNSDPFGTKDVMEKIEKNKASDQQPVSGSCTFQAGLKCLDYKVAPNNIQITIQNLLGYDLTDFVVWTTCGTSKSLSVVRNGESSTLSINCLKTLSGTKYDDMLVAGFHNTGVLYPPSGLPMYQENKGHLTAVIEGTNTVISVSTDRQIEPKELDINSIVNQGKKLTKSLKDKEQIKFNILGEDHSMTIDKISSNSVTITFSSSPLTFIIDLLKTIIVDINEDNKGDLAVTLKSISNGIADLEFSQPSGNEQITKPINKATTPTINFNANMKYIVIGIITLVVLISSGYGLVTIYKKRPKRVKEEKAERSEEEVVERPAISKSADAISVSGFSLSHGKNVILNNVSFEIKRGELVCLLGPSGTGKSTVIESLVGRKTPDKGTIKILGEDIKKNKKIMDYVGFVPQGAEIYMNQTAEQNLLTSATKWGIKDAKKKAERILSDINLTQRANIEAKKLSGGQQKLLSLGMELIREPELLILDEPTTGLDPNTRNNIITIISQIVAHRHKTALFTTHFMDDAEECDNVIILADKKIIAQGNPSKLKKMLPGMGRIVNVILDNVTDDLLNKIKKIEGIKEIIREGRSLKVIIEEPNAVKLGQKIDELGGVVNKTEIVNATMKEVFVYFTGKQPEE